MRLSTSWPTSLLSSLATDSYPPVGRILEVVADPPLSVPCGPGRFGPGGPSNCIGDWGIFSLPGSAGVLVPAGRSRILGILPGGMASPGISTTGPGMAWLDDFLLRGSFDSLGAAADSRVLHVSPWSGAISALRIQRNFASCLLHNPESPRGADRLRLPACGSAFPAE